MSGARAGSPAPISSGDAPRLITAQALSLGFDAVGFAPASLGPEARERLGQFIAAGQHGDMGWLAARMAERSHSGPRRAA